MKTVRDKQAKIVQVATTNARTIIYNLINVYQPYPKLITEHKEAIDQAPKKLEELLLESLPENNNLGYNQALEDTRKAIKELMK